MAKKKTSSGSSQASLPLGGASKRKVAVKGYTRSFTKSKLPPRARNGRWKKR